MKILGLHHVAVQVRDVARVAAFYTELLQLPELRRFHRPDGSLRSIWVGTSTGQEMSQTPGGFIAVEGVEAGASGTLGYSMVALRIEPSQRRSIVEEFGRRGLPIERETGWTLYVRDPEGNLVGLSHHPDDTPSMP